MTEPPRYPGYDVLTKRDTPSWNAKTREVIEQRLATPNAPRFEPALFVKSQVMSRGAAHAVVDAGHKSHALDSGMPAVWRRELAYTSGGDEHGILRPRPAAAASALPALDETIWLVPGHCDPTVNLHDHYVGVRGGLAVGVVESIWPIEARGAVR